MFNHLNSTQKGMILAFGGYMAFSMSDASVKWLTGLGYSVYQVIAVDTLIGSALMLAFAPLLGGISSLRDGQNYKIHGSRILLNTLVNLLIVYCFSTMSLAMVYVAIFTLPFMAAVFSMFIYGEKIGVHRWVSIAVGFSGILIAFQPWNKDFDFIQMILPIGTTVLITLMFLITRSLKDSSPLAIGFYPVIGCSVLVWPLAIFDFHPIAIADLPFFVSSGAFMALGVIGVSVAFRMADSAVISPLLYFELFWAIVFGILFFNDVPNLWMLVGAAIIILSGIHMVRREQRAHKINL